MGWLTAPWPREGGAAAGAGAVPEDEFEAFLRSSGQLGGGEGGAAPLARRTYGSGPGAAAEGYPALGGGVGAWLYAAAGRRRRGPCCHVASRESAPLSFLW